MDAQALCSALMSKHVFPQPPYRLENVGRVIDDFRKIVLQDIDLRKRDVRSIMLKEDLPHTDPKLILDISVSNDRPGTLHHDRTQWIGPVKFYQVHRLDETGEGHFSCSPTNLQTGKPVR